MSRVVFIGLFVSLLSSCVFGNTYCGRVLDVMGSPLSFATVFPVDSPILGTITNDSGYFTLVGDFNRNSHLVVSYIGYEKQSISLSEYGKLPKDSCLIITLNEQPIELNETVISSSKKRLTKKQKNVANILYKTFLALNRDFADKSTLYHFVSDARLQSSGKDWGMEQLIGKAVVYPGLGKEIRSTSMRNDSVQFAPMYCKRFFLPSARRQANSILSQEDLDSNIKNFALGIDSGVVVHRAFFDFGNPKTTFERYMQEISKWSIETSDDKIFLTYTNKRNFLGIVAYNYQLHYVVNAIDYKLMTYYQTGNIKVKIPFGKKLDVSQLKILNLFNMSDEEISKFRLKSLSAQARMNTHFISFDEKLYLDEKTIVADALISGSRHIDIPLHIEGTLKVTNVVSNPAPLRKEEQKKFIKRQIVEIF